MKIRLTKSQIKQLYPILRVRSSKVPSMILASIKIEYNDLHEGIGAYMNVALVKDKEALLIQKLARKGCIQSMLKIRKI